MKKLLGTIILVLITLLINVPFTSAGTISLIFEDLDSSATLTIADGDANDSNPLPDMIVFSNSDPNDVGVWDLDMSLIYIQNPGEPPVLLLGGSIYSNAASSLRILAIQTDLEAEPVQFNLASGGTTDGQVAVSAYYDYGNSNDTLSLGLFAPVAFDGSAQSPPVMIGDVHDIALEIVITHSEGEMLTTLGANLEIIPVPEPSIIVLSALGLFGVGLLKRSM